MINNPSVVSGRRGRQYGTFLELFQATFTGLMVSMNLSCHVEIRY